MSERSGVWREVFVSSGKLFMSDSLIDFANCGVAYVSDTKQLALVYTVQWYVRYAYTLSFRANHPPAQLPNGRGVNFKGSQQNNFNITKINITKRSAGTKNKLFSFTNNHLYLPIKQVQL